MEHLNDSEGLSKQNCQSAFFGHTNRIVCMMRHAERTLWEWIHEITPARIFQLESEKQGTSDVMLNK